MPVGGEEGGVVAFHRFAEAAELLFDQVVDGAFRVGAVRLALAGGYAGEDFNALVDGLD